MTQVLPVSVNVSTANEFIARHIGPRAGDEQAMLNSLGFDSLEALSASVIPDSIKGTSVLGLEDGLSEADALALIKSIAGKKPAVQDLHRSGLLRHSHAVADPA